MKHEIRITRGEVIEAVTEWLAKRGYMPSHSEEYWSCWYPQKGQNSLTMFQLEVDPNGVVDDDPTVYERAAVMLMDEYKLKAKKE